MSPSDSMPNEPSTVRGARVPQGGGANAAQPGFHANHEQIRSQLQRWQERVLDLKKSNPLLGLNRSRVSKLNVVDPDGEALFKRFAIDGQELRMPFVEKASSSPRLQELALTDDETDRELLRVQAGDVEFDASSAELRRRLRRIYDNARTTVEERGVTTLFLTFGALRWKDAILGESVSPLWMVPCELSSKGPNIALRLTMADEEMQLNPALQYYIRERHKITLQELPENPDAQSLASYLKETLGKVKEQGWSVEPEVWLSTFTFESLVIYQDLKAMTDTALANPVVAALARASSQREASEALPHDLDSLPTPDTVPISILPSDSSQLEALTHSANGRHVVMHGPPGTGKSQTISNLIADALGRNKKVLFVSAKMAALNVVYARLKAEGLGRFCLEAHSTKAGKSHIIDDLRRTLEADALHDRQRLNEDLQSLVAVRQQLNEYVRELHEKRSPLELSVFQVLGKVSKLHEVPDIRAPLPWKDVLSVERSELAKALDALDQLVASASRFDQRYKHPWRGLVALAMTITDREALEDGLRYVHEAMTSVATSIGNLSPFVAEPETMLLKHFELLSSSLENVSTLDALPKNWWQHSTEDLEGLSQTLQLAAMRAEESAEKQPQYDRLFDLPARQAVQLLEPAMSTFRRWYGRVKPAYWQWRFRVVQHLKQGAKRDFGALRSYLQLATSLVANDDWFRNCRNQIHTQVDQTDDQNPTVLAKAAHRTQVAAQLQRELSLCGLAPRTQAVAIDARTRHANLALLKRLPGNDSKLKDTLKNINHLWPDGFVDNLNVFDATPAGIAHRCSELIAALPKIQEWIVLQGALNTCHQQGLRPFIEQLGTVSGVLARQAFERRFFTIWASTAIEHSNHLANFNSARRGDLIEKFRLLDERIRRSALEQIRSFASDPAYRVKSARDTRDNATEIGILRYELQKKKRIRPLRRLFSEIPHVLQALKPCMLMSPISVSTFLKPGALEFDLVVFDEASQLPTPEAVPSILRAKQVVVAGDANQLPPTSFFEASLLVEEEEADEDQSAAVEPLESLLDDCVAVVPLFEETYLRWHYRSRDERLITFSNHYFYENGLVTFPSSAPSDERHGVHLIYVADGIWDRGRSRTNRREAREVAKLVIDHFEHSPEKSLGVVALNTYQREAIEDAINEALRERPDLVPLLDVGRSENFFVKSLESVQGDERDTMIISVGYAKDRDGSLTMNFGPINRDGGWRRLNVLITRAKWKTILVTSLRSNELNGINPQNRGATALRNFIEYAERGAELPAAPAQLTDAEANDFEDAVRSVLVDRGFEVDAQVGASRFRIDLAVRDKRDRARYLLGVECDGATYHSSRSARDRDLLRQHVLQRMGWRLHRVWSTEWFYEREKAINSLLRSIEQAQATPISDLVSAPPVPSNAAPSAIGGNGGNSTTPQASPRPRKISRAYSAGQPYAKYSGHRRRNRDILIKSSYAWSLADEVADVVAFEGPIHEDLLTERLKDLHGVARAGSNIQQNISQAIKYAIRKGRIRRGQDKRFLVNGHGTVDSFRPGKDDTKRALELIAPEEIEQAVLHIVEDQFGVVMEHLPTAVAEVFGIERLHPDGAERIRGIVDELLQHGRLRVSGRQVHLP